MGHPKESEWPLCSIPAGRKCSCSFLSQLTSSQKALKKGSKREGRKGIAICGVHLLPFIHSFIIGHRLCAGHQIVIAHVLSHRRGSGPARWGWDRGWQYRGSLCPPSPSAIQDLARANKSGLAEASESQRDLWLQGVWGEVPRTKNGRKPL